MIDPIPTEKEIREAEALAEALEGGPGGGAPEEALAVAALLNHARDEGALRPARRRAILDEIMPAPPPAPWRRWALWLTPVAATAAGLLVATSLWQAAPPAARPRPSLALLQAQAQAAAGGPEALRALSEEMAAHRGDLWADLSQRYPR